MASSNEPLIKLEPGGKAPILSYNVPESTTYTGSNLIELQFLHPDKEFFKPAAFEKPKVSRTPVKGLDISTIKPAVLTAMKTGFSDQKLFPNVRLTTATLRYMDKPNQGYGVVSSLPTNPKLAQVDPDEVAFALQAGKRLNVYKSLYGTLTYNFVSEPTEADPRLYLVEIYRLSSFLGNYGAGRILKTMTLLPGEKTKVSIKTYTKTEQQSKNASSILDSFTQESSDDFENSVQDEQSDKRNSSKTFEYHAEAEASASWGWGSAKVSGGVKGGTNSAREEFSKNVSNATQKHAAKASAKRDVQINTSYEVKEETGEETSIEREIENINLSRTLNFVFRQMNQEFFTFLTLVDVRVAFFNNFAELAREVALPELQSLLDQFVLADKHAEARQVIVEQLQNVFDYEGVSKSVIEEKVLSDNDKYLRFVRAQVSDYKDKITKAEFSIPGFIMAVTKNVMRTEGVIVEALLGQGEALDGYATRLQELEVTRREAEVAQKQTEAQRAELLNQVIRDNDADRAKLLVDLTCPCGPDSEVLRVTVDSNGKEAPK
jgi:hypothetical protein